MLSVKKLGSLRFEELNCVFPVLRNQSVQTMQDRSVTLHVQLCAGVNVRA